MVRTDQISFLLERLVELLCQATGAVHAVVRFAHGAIHALEACLQRRLQVVEGRVALRGELERAADLLARGGHGRS